MAETINVAGIVGIKIATTLLGYSINGVEIAEEMFYGDVHGDQNGGDEGPPIDIQYFGEVHRITVEMSKYDLSIASAVLAKLAGGAAGTTGTPGTLMIGGAKYFRLLLHAANAAMIRNYPVAFLRGQPVEINKGTKFSRLRLTFEAHHAAAGGSSLIWNTSTA